MQGKFDVYVFSNHNGRHKENRSSLDVAKWPPMSMLRRSVEVFCLASKTVSVQRNVVSRWRRGMELLSERTIAKLALPANKVLEAEVLPLLRWIQEDCRAGSKCADSTTTGLISAVRILLEYCPDRLQDGRNLSEVIDGCLPQLRRSYGTLNKSGLPQEIAQLAHFDWDDLRQKTYHLVQRRRAAIEKAARSEFERYEALVRRQTEWLTLPIPESVRSKVEDWLDSDKATAYRVDLKGLPLIEIAAVLLQRQAAEAVPLDKFGWPKWDNAVPTSLERLDGFKEYRWRMSSAPWSYARHRLPNPILTTIFIAILNHTGWNPGSLGELTMDRIEVLPGDRYRIQGYKSKTDDDTPAVDVPKSVRVVHKAITLLIWNHKQLKKLSLIQESEQRLWFGWQIDKFQAVLDCGLSTRIDLFCSRNGIERFNLSELRPMAAAVTYLPQRDLEAVRILLGHKDLQTSDAYLRDTLFFRLNEANMLQFQRRIETSLIFSLGGEPRVAKMRLSPRDIDPALLVPTGDGGTCSAPFDGPPQLQLKVGEPCAGLHCQQGEGCPHYRLQVDRNTIELALRTRIYYRARWSTLFQSNPIAFRQIHLPRLLFIHVLISVIHTMRPDLLRDAERALK